MYRRLEHRLSPRTNLTWPHYQSIKAFQHTATPTKKLAILSSDSLRLERDFSIFLHEDRPTHVSMLKNNRAGATWWTSNCSECVDLDFSGDLHPTASVMKDPVPQTCGSKVTRFHF